MKRILITIFALACSTQAHAFQGFEMFQMTLDSLECLRKPNTDMVICKLKTPEPEEVEPLEPIITPEPEPEPESVGWDLYNRERIYFNDSEIKMAGCADPSKNLVYLNLDVDLDGDQDVIFGFTCFKPVTDTEYLKQHVTYDEFYGWIADQYLAVFINNDGVFENDQTIFGGE